MAETLRSINPASGELVWEQPVTGAEACIASLATARARLQSWSRTPLTERIAFAQRYAEVLEARREALAEAFSRETGKLLWDAELPYSGDSTPLTYMAGGKQYVVIGTSGSRDPHGPKGTAFVAYALAD